ncbi:MAG: MotA/TolQ/ExbB proton channel family protein [Cycloclasticus sp.]
MRILSVFNVTLLMLLVSLVILISPSHLFALINIPGLLVVLGGTLCALVPYRSSQLRLLEQEIKLAQQPVLLKGVQLILDRCSADDVANILRKERARLLRPNQEKSQMLRLMSGYAPAFGMLGTLLGMIYMLYGLGEVGLEQVGTTMGFALLTTLYGLVVANLVCKPLAIKLEKRTAEHAAHLNTLLEGLAMMHEKTYPMVIRDMLEAHGIPAATPPAPGKRVKGRLSKLLPLVAAHVD